MPKVQGAHIPEPPCLVHKEEGVSQACRLGDSVSQWTETW